MTRLYELINRCPKCGYKKVYLVDWDTWLDASQNQKVFNEEPCKKCKPQTSLDSWGLHKGLIEK